MKKGFTLIEVIGVVVLLSLIAIFTVPSLVKTSKESSEKAYYEYEKNIKIAAEGYFHNETDATYDKYFVSVKTLLKEDYLKNQINPKTKEKMNPNTTVVITKNGKEENYEIVEGDLTSSGYADNGLLLLYDGYTKPKNGIWKDLSGHENDGILNNFSDSSINSNSIKFDGVNDYIKATNNLNFPSGNASYTMEISIYYDKLKNRNNLINLGIYNSPGNANGMYIYNSNRISHWYWNNDLGTDELLSEKGKYTIVSLYDGENRKIYLNGNMVASDKAIPNTVIGNVTIGDEIPGQDGFFNGEVFSVRIYNRALTDEEIQNNHNIDKYRFGV